MARRVTSLATPIAHLVGPGKIKVVNGQLAFTAEGQGPVRLDPSALCTLLCYGNVGVTDQAMRVLWQHEVEVAWLSASGIACRGRLVRADASAAGLRLLQHRVFSDAAERLAIARGWVQGKITAMQAATRHYQRQGRLNSTDVPARLQVAAAAAERAADLDQVRGAEGTASAAWFELLGQLLKPPWTFPRRARRPPPDPVNALLSLGYTWLLTRAVARCEAAGLEVYLGTLHAFRPGRPSLACDVMEPLRVPAVDRWLLPLLNRGQLAPDDFVAHAESGFRLQPSAFGRILRDWEEHWLHGGHEGALDQSLQALIAHIRQCGRERFPLESGPEADL